MARRKSPPVESELNLAPIMNMVVILIPMLLLSVVFLKVGTVNVTAPSLAPGPPSVVTEEEPLNLTVAIREDGFHVMTSNTKLASVEGCPAGGATVCLASKDQNGVKFSPDADTAAVEASLALYDWPELYNTLVRIKSAHAGETTIHIKGDPNVPYALVVRLMDVARFRLEKDVYSNESELWSARTSGRNERASLFPDPIIVP